MTAILREAEAVPKLANPPRIHETADVTPCAMIGDGTSVWHQALVREGAQIGENCIIGKGVCIDAGVTIGSNCKIQNDALDYSGATLGDGAFIGPAVILTNDRYLRAINPDGEIKRALDWDHGTIFIDNGDNGAAIGAGAVLVTNIRIGRFATIGAGAVVTHDVPPHALMIGSPAYQCSRVCHCGRPLTGEVACSTCGDTIEGVHS